MKSLLWLSILWENLCVMRVSECSGGAILVDFLINQFQKKASNWSGDYRTAGVY